MTYLQVAFHFMFLSTFGMPGGHAAFSGVLRLLLFTLFAGYMTMDVVGTSAFGCALCGLAAASVVLYHDLNMQRGWPSR